jgi:DNA-binding NtrC family response regulator
MPTRVATKTKSKAEPDELNVLIVEDNEMIMRMVTQMCEIEPGVVVRSGGADAGLLIDVRAWEGVDVAIVDLLLPETDGETLLDWLAEEAPHVRRIAMSGSGAWRLDKANAEVKLLKPFLIDELLEALRP